jgi:ABC-type protease/lipase transport system fused ATPase/permease subunit
VGYVPQQIDFFGASVAENIARLGEVDSEEVVKAAELAGIHEMILKLPQGYDTMLGERGYPLSGGQRQRISIARALYKSPRLVVLDEPNSALDDLGEYMLMRAIKTLKAQGTMFVVTTHRPRLVAVVDEILLVNEGKQVAFGPAKDILDAMNRQKQEIERQRKESMAKTLKVVPSAGASNSASTPIKAEAS